jgi:hypothetical protein
MTSGISTMNTAEPIAPVSWLYYSQDWAVTTEESKGYLKAMELASMPVKTCGPAQLYDREPLFDPVMVASSARIGSTHTSLSTTPSTSSNGRATVLKGG